MSRGYEVHADEMRDTLQVNQQGVGSSRPALLPAVSARGSSRRLDAGERDDSTPLRQVQIDDAHYVLTGLNQIDSEGRVWGRLISVRDETGVIEKEQFWERITYGVLILGGLLILLLVKWFLGRACGSLNYVVEVMRSISAGDLTVEVAVDREDEIGQLERSAHVMIQRLRLLLEKVSRSAAGLVDVSSCLSNSAEATLQDMENQQNQTRMVAKGSRNNNSLFWNADPSGYRLGQAVRRA